MSNPEALANYRKSLQQLRLQAHDLGINDNEFNHIFQSTLFEVEKQTSLKKVKQDTTKVKLAFAAFIIIAAILLNYRVFYSIILCNIQDLLYPGLKLLRKASLPLVSMFPTITDLYDESCIIQNPYFQVKDMDCWPCSMVTSVHQTDDPINYVKQFHGEPFIYKTNQLRVNISNLRDNYYKHKEVFDKDAPKVRVNHKIIMTPEEVFKLLLNENNSDMKRFIWRMNRMGPAQKIRTLFPRPAVVPRHGQSTERFVILDKRSDTYKLPDTECHFVFLLQAKGERNIELTPVNECADHCKPVSVRLQESYLLSYDNSALSGCIAMVHDITSDCPWANHLSKRVHMFGIIGGIGDPQSIHQRIMLHLLHIWDHIVDITKIIKATKS